MSCCTAGAIRKRTGSLENLTRVECISMGKVKPEDQTSVIYFQKGLSPANAFPGPVRVGPPPNAARAFDCCQGGTVGTGLAAPATGGGPKTE
jgi:hypothetical protein